MTTCQTCRAQGFEPRKSGCSFCSGEYGGGRPTPRPVPVHVIRCHQTHNIEPDLKAGDLRIPSLNEVWHYAPRRDNSEAPDQNRDWFDRGPATRIGYDNA